MKLKISIKSKVKIYHMAHKNTRKLSGDFKNSKLIKPEFIE